MTTCALCGNKRADGSRTLIRSAYMQSVERVQLAQGERMTLTYNQFREHDYFACRECQRATRIYSTAIWILTAVAMAGSVIGFIALRPTNQEAAGWLFLLVLVSLVAGGIVASLRNVDRRLKQLAVRERVGEGDLSDTPRPAKRRFRGFTESEFRGLKSTMPSNE